MTQRIQCSWLSFHISEEIVKAKQLKLPQLWNHQSFLDYHQYEHVKLKFSKARQEEKITSISISVIVYSRSSYLIQFSQFQNLMNMDYTSTRDVKWRSEQATVQMKRYSKLWKDQNDWRPPDGIYHSWRSHSGASLTTSLRGRLLGTPFYLLTSEARSWRSL